MVRLERQSQHVPALLGALARDQLTASRGHWTDQHRLAAAWAPEEVREDEVNAVLVSLALVCLFHMPSIPRYRPLGKG
jgi:hypothetical protein